MGSTEKFIEHLPEEEQKILAALGALFCELVVEDGKMVVLRGDYIVLEVPHIAFESEGRLLIDDLAILN